MSIEKTLAPERRQYLRSWAQSVRHSAKHLEPAPEAQMVPSRYNIKIRLKAGGVLIFNSFTRALCRLTADEATALDCWLEGDKVNQIGDSKFIRAAINDGYLVPQDKDELDAAQQAYFAARHDPSQMMLTIAPTMACNLACGYCFQGLDKDVSKLEKNVPGGIVDFVKAQPETLKFLNVTWYGGEPLMAKKHILALADRLISHCDMQGIQFSSSIVTNGYFLTAELAEQLWSRRCTSAQVTVDGVQATHDKMRPLLSGRGSFKQIMVNLQEVLDKTPLAISLRVNVGQQNAYECDQLLMEFEQRGFGQGKKFSVYFAPIDAATAESGTAAVELLARKEFNEFVVGLGERARKMGLAPPLEVPKGILGMCVAASDNGYVVTHKGDIHKCWETAHDAKKRIGTIFAPEKLTHSLNAKAWAAWSPFDSEICRSCKILPMCGGFCGHRFLYNGLGDEQSLPCPDWKWNTAEYLFARAKSLGAVQEGEWLPQEATVDAMQSGQRHSVESLRAAQAVVLKEISNHREETISVDQLLYGDGLYGEYMPESDGQNMIKLIQE